MDGSATTSFHTTAAPRQVSGEVLVLGLGNVLLGDHGVGVHVVRRLLTDPGVPTGLWALDGGTLGFRLMEAFARSDTILLVDAAQLGATAGTIRLLGNDALDQHVRLAGRVSAHEAGLIDLLTLAKLEFCAPSRLALLGIQPERVDYGDALSRVDGDDALSSADCNQALSPRVARAVPAACQVAIETVLRWQGSI